MNTERKIIIIPGDGIGKEVTNEAVKVIEHINHSSCDVVNYEYFNRDADFYLEHGYILKDSDIKSLTDGVDGILFGAIGDPRIPNMEHGRELLLKLRQSLDLYVNFRPIRAVSSCYSPLKENRVEGADMVIFRENTQGLYTQVGGSVAGVDGTQAAMDTAYYSTHSVDRIIREAFEWAVANDRRRVDLVDKANAVTNIGQLWRTRFRKTSKEFNHIETGEHYIDAYCQRMVSDPRSIDVVVSSNLFGDILGDLGAGVVGGLGITPSANINPQSGIALFEPVHGSAPDIAGQGIANPVASLYSLALLYNHLRLDKWGKRITAAVDEYLQMADSHKTPDLGGEAGTSDVTEQIISLIDVS
jgi:3-isopropylmalate dehydrogenase